MSDPADPWSFPGVPEPPAWTVDWPPLEARFAWLRELAGCPQDPVFHAEGDVLVHTRLVAGALAADPAWRALPPAERAVHFAAALLHDAGKPGTTVVEADGRVSSRGHARRGARLARRVLYRGEGVDPPPPAVRERVVALVRHHALPLHALDRPDPRRAVVTVSQAVRPDRLAALAEADVRGRVAADVADLLDRVELFRELAREEGCLDRPYPFPSDHARYAYLTGGGADPAFGAYDGTAFEVVLMAGLPAAGKTRWVAEHLAGWPVVSLDALRRELRVGPEEAQGPVVAAAKERARAFLRARERFVWDATNVSRAVRGPLVALFAGYRARVRLVYVEAPYGEMVRRNRARPAPVPDAVVERLVDRLDVPEAGEAHRVEWVWG